MTTTTLTASIDCDFVINTWNKANPNLFPLDRNRLAQKCATNNRSLLNYKKGETPKLFMQIYRLCEHFDFKFKFKDIVYQRVVGDRIKIYFDFDLVFDHIELSGKAAKEKWLADFFEFHENSFTRWKRGELPFSLYTVIMFSELSGIEFEELLIIKKQ